MHYNAGSGVQPSPVGMEQSLAGAATAQEHTVEQTGFPTTSEGSARASEQHQEPDKAQSADQMEDNGSRQHNGQRNVSAQEQNTDERPWDSVCPEPFAWDGRSSLMVCVDPDKRIWYQAHVVKKKGDEYLLSWPGE